MSTPNGSQYKASWSEFFGRLEARGSCGVDLVVPEDHKELGNAVESHFQGASRQRCQTRFIRNLLEACPKAGPQELHGPFGRSSMHRSRARRGT
ncbi:MAG: transposase [Thermodesulfobacteriota bacterium]